MEIKHLGKRKTKEPSVRDEERPLPNEKKKKKKGLGCVCSYLIIIANAMGGKGTYYDYFGRITATTRACLFSPYIMTLKKN